MALDPSGSVSPVPARHPGECRTPRRARQRKHARAAQSGPRAWGVVSRVRHLLSPEGADWAGPESCDTA